MWRRIDDWAGLEKLTNQHGYTLDTVPGSGAVRVGLAMSGVTIYGAESFAEMAGSVANFLGVEWHTDDLDMIYYRCRHECACDLCWHANYACVTPGDECDCLQFDLLPVPARVIGARA